MQTRRYQKTSRTARHLPSEIYRTSQQTHWYSCPCETTIDSKSPSSSALKSARLNGPSYSAECAGSRQQSRRGRPTYAVNVAGTPVYATCRKDCSLFLQRPVRASTSPMKQTPWYVFLIYLSNRGLLSRGHWRRLVSTEQPACSLSNAHHIPRYYKSPCRPGNQSKYSIGVPLRAQKGISQGAPEIRRLTRIPLDPTLSGFAVTCLYSLSMAAGTVVG